MRGVLIRKAVSCRARRVWATSVLMLASLAGSRARADVAEAQALAARAHQRDALGDHEGAIALFAQAYRAEANPEYLRETAGQYLALTAQEPAPRTLRQALASCRQYLLAAHNPPDAAEVQARMAELEKRIAILPAVPEQPRATAVEEVDIELIAAQVGVSYRVSMGGKSCQTPCTLSLKPGTDTLTVTGLSTWHIDLVVPSTPGVVRIEPNPHDLVLAGSLLLAGGVAVGASLWTLAFLCPSGPECQVTQVSVWPTVGGLAVLSGIAVLAWSGAHPARTIVETADAAPPESPRLRLAFAGVQPLHNGVGTSIGFEF